VTTTIRLLYSTSQFHYLFCPKFPPTTTI